MPRQRSYKPRIFGRTGAAAAGDVPVQDNLSDFMDIVRVGVEDQPAVGGDALPQYGPPVPTAEDLAWTPEGTSGTMAGDNQALFAETAWKRQQDYIRNNRPNFIKPSQYTDPRPNPNAPLTPPEYQDPGATVRGMLKWLPLIGLLGGPRAIGAIAPGAIGGVANYAQQDYANRLNAYRTAEGARNAAYDNALNRWKAGADLSAAEQQAITGYNREQGDQFKTELGGHTAFAEARDKSADQQRRSLTAQLNTASKQFASGKYSFEQAKTIIADINNIKGKLARLGGVDSTMIDPDAMSQLDYLNQAHLEADKLKTAVDKQKMWTDAYREVGKYGPDVSRLNTLDRIKEDARQADMRNRIAIREQDRRDQDDTWRYELGILNINAQNLRSVADLQAALGIKQADLDAQFGKEQGAQLGSEYHILSNEMVRTAAEWDQLTKEQQSYRDYVGKMKDVRGWEPDPDEEMRYQMRQQSINAVIRKQAANRDNMNAFLANKRKGAQRTLINTPSVLDSLLNPLSTVQGAYNGVRVTNPAAAPNAGKAGAEPQKGAGKFSGGRRATTDSNKAKAGTSGGQAGAVNPKIAPKAPGTNTKLPPDVKAVRGKGVTPDEQAELDALP